MKLLLLRALATVGVVGLLCVGYVVVGVLEAHWDEAGQVQVARAERDTLAAQLAGVRADSVAMVAAIQRAQARLVATCGMLPFADLDSCLATVDARLDRRARGTR